MSKWTDQISTFLYIPTDQVLAITAWGEARGEGGEGMMAVLNVINNRVLRGGWYVDKEILALTGDPHKAVALMKYQFSMFLPSDPNFNLAQRIALNFDSYYNSDTNLRLAWDLADMLLKGELDDNTNGADTYYNPQIANDPGKGTYPVTAQIGRHVFEASSPMVSVAKTVIHVAEAAGEQVSEVIQEIIPEPVAAVVETVSESVGETVVDIAAQIAPDTMEDPETREEVKQAVKKIVPLTMVTAIFGIGWLIYKNIKG